jgi:WhiB family redox-sensing transcriptional regulator
VEQPDITSRPADRSDVIDDVVLNGVTRMDWRHRALCRDEDPELFFPIGTTGPAERQTEAAKGVCRSCAVVTDCLQWAMETGQDAGIWGGLTEDERRTLKRRGSRQRARTA